jgi:SAM-dependent methyltransferase
VDTERLKATLQRRPRVAAAVQRTLRVTSWASHLAKTGQSTEPDAAARLGFRSDFERFRASNAADGRFALRWEDRFPQFGDRTDSVPFEPHYLYHPAWAARCLARIAPQRHVDISSYLPFVTMVSAFVPIDYYEFRPTPLDDLSGLTSGQADLTALPFADDSVASLSCLHVIEHLGLGRYGDPIDAGADRRALAELRRVLAPGGNLLVAMPVGPAHVRYNAHRVYSVELVCDALAGLELVEFALVLEDGSGLATGDRARSLVPEQSRTVSGGTGCFWFRAPA